MTPAYLDSSAAVKLVAVEQESAALRAWLSGRVLVSSVLLRVEVMRAVRPDGPDALERALRLMRRFELFRISRLVLRRAESLEPGQLRTLDAIHLATAELVTRSRHALVSYDDRMLRAADLLGFRVASPF